MLIKISNMTRKELILSAIKSWNLDLATDEEKNNWGYKTKLNYSYKFLIDKKVYYKGCEYKISDIRFDKFKKMLLVLNSGLLLKPTQVTVELFNPFSDNIIKFDLNPSRNIKNLLENGYILDEKYFKSIYYKSEEYRGIYEKSLELSTGIKSIKAPIQSKNIKDKISKTIKERYGVDWFLNRGVHYDIVTNNIYKKYKEDEIKLFKVLGVSKFEIEVISCLLDNVNFSDDLYYFSKDKNQYYFKLKDRFKAVDFFDKKNNFIIEINGDYFHSNSEFYNAEDLNTIKNKKVKDIWFEENEILEEIVEKYKSKIFVIWENDWKKDKERIIKEIKLYYENC